MASCSEIDEADDDADFEGSVGQALALLNGALLSEIGSSAVPGTALAEVIAQLGNDADRIDSIYLRVVARASR